MQPFTLLIKPSGSDCNLDCSYCFYKNRSPEIGTGKQRMSHEVLERLVADYMRLSFPVAGFSWQGGEPMLMGLDFYEKAVELQKKYARPGQVVSNALQTNAVLIDQRWCEFLRENKFLVGISIDGPADLHDRCRKDHAGRGSFDKVIRAIELCRRNKVEFNLLTLLNRFNADYPDRLFDFLTKLGTKYLQFIPCVETDPATGTIADFAVTAEQYASFMCRIFDRWCDFGPQKLSIRDFDSILSFCLTGRHTICTFDRQCSQYIVVEHTGDCFPCDFFVEPKWRLGNIFETPIDKIAACEKKRTFARDKLKLANACLVCPHLDLCRGGCTKDKLPDAGRSQPLSYLCPAYRRFFDYAMPRFLQVAARLAADQTPNTPRRTTGS